jgi:hypothetical protein
MKGYGIYTFIPDVYEQSFCLYKKIRHIWDNSDPKFQSSLQIIYREYWTKHQHLIW